VFCGAAAVHDIFTIVALDLWTKKPTKTVFPSQNGRRRRTSTLQTKTIHPF